MPFDRSVQPNVGIYAADHVVWATHVLGGLFQRGPWEETGGSPPEDDTQAQALLAPMTHERWLRAYQPNLLRLGVPLPRFDLPPLTEPAALASVVRNCWIARCPWCAGAEGVWAADDWFYCCSCGNQPVGGQRVAIVFAQAPAEVEAVLHARPEPHTRNWLPERGETVAHLVAENRTHGLAERMRYERGDG